MRELVWYLLRMPFHFNIYMCTNIFFFFCINCRFNAMGNSLLYLSMNSSHKLCERGVQTYMKTISDSWSSGLIILRWQVIDHHQMVVIVLWLQRFGFFFCQEHFLTLMNWIIHLAKYILRFLDGIMVRQIFKSIGILVLFQNLCHFE